MAVVGIGICAAVGLVVFWPTGKAPDLGSRPNRFVDATITKVQVDDCPSIEVAGALSGCRIYEVRIDTGAETGSDAAFTVLETQFEVPELEVGDEVVLLDSPSSPTQFRYAFADLQRTLPLVGLAVLFGVVVLAFGRLRGLRALLGLGASAMVLVVFIVPALLRDSPSLPVALVGTITVAYFALYLAHGVNPATTVALAGTLASLAVIALLSAGVASLAHLSGLGDDAAQTIRVTAGAIDLRGLLVAGFIVGALGVLDDVTVTQVSTVQALLRADPDVNRLHLYREATHVGRDHIASTVNTLVLAYAGASLPLLLFFAQGNAPTGRILTGELVSVEIIRMLVGSIGLVLSVPFTTALAAVCLTPEHALVGHDHGHSHRHDHRHDDRNNRGRGAGHAGEETRGEDPSTGPKWEDFGPRD